jgi:glycerol kinase
MKYVGAIDQGTSSSRFILFDESGRSVASHQTEFPQHMPQNGWVEHDPMQILESVNTCIGKVMQTHNASDVVGLGITNQRETTVVWDRVTGKPLYNAIVWLDTRTADLCDRLTAAAPGGTRDAYRSICGLPISTYFSGVKLRWLLENVPAVREAADQGRAAFGTIESWLIWCLSGGLSNPQKALHVTDVTNASRTMLMDLKTRQWDQSMLQAFGIPSSLLPRITSNSEVFGSVAEGPLAGVNISGVRFQVLRIKFFQNVSSSTIYLRIRPSVINKVRCWDSCVSMQVKPRTRTVPVASCC